MEKSYGNEAEDFRKRSVLAICSAGSDRSRYISEELNNRGYFSSHAGVRRGQNYVTEEDLASVGIIVFSSVHEKNIFDRDGRLLRLIQKRGINIRILNITESDKNRAHDNHKIEELKEEIRRQLDLIGLKKLEDRVK